MIKKVQIPQEIILEVQRLWFEQQSNLYILGYLMTQNDINKELLAEYNQDTKTRFTECEMYKQKIADLYNPFDFNCQYIFDFDNNLIQYSTND